MKTLWLYLHFPMLPLEVFNLEATHEKPVVIVEKQQVCRVDKKAQAYGIQVGSSLATARALCQELHTLERHTRSEHALLANLADHAYRFSSLVCVTPPDGITLEVAGSSRLFNGMTALLTGLADQLHERGIHARMGLAPSPEGARLFAYAMPCLEAKPPDWLDDDLLDGYRKQLARLSLDYLECSPRQKQRMQQAGFSQIGDVLALPASAIARRFGQEVLHYIRELNVEQITPCKAYIPPDAFNEALHFPEPLRDNNGLMFPMQRLLRDLNVFLERRQAHAQRIEWTFQDSDNKQHQLSIPCSLKHNSLTAMINLTQLAMERFKAGSMIDSIQLHCHQFNVTQADHKPLFNDRSMRHKQYDQEELALLLDRLCLRLGSERVHALSVRDSHIPEYSWSSAPVNHSIDAKPVSPLLVSQGNNALDVPAEPTRPFWLFPEPQPLHQRRRQLYWKQRLRLLSGPERITGLWWDKPTERDYYVAQSDGSELCWIYFDRLTHKWFIHGLFG